MYLHLLIRSKFKTHPSPLLISKVTNCGSMEGSARSALHSQAWVQWSMIEWCIFWVELIPKVSGFQSLTICFFFHIIFSSCFLKDDCKYKMISPQIVSIILVFLKGNPVGSDEHRLPGHLRRTRGYWKHLVSQVSGE